MDGYAAHVEEALINLVGLGGGVAALAYGYLSAT